MLIFLTVSLAAVCTCYGQVALYNVTWQDLKPTAEGGRILEEQDCIIAIPDPYGDTCVAGTEIGLRLKLAGDHSRWKGLGFYPYDPANEEQRFLVEDIADGGADMTGIIPGRDMNTNYIVLWKAERTGIIRPGDDYYPAYMITNAAEFMENGVVYDFNWAEDAENC